MSVTDTAWAPAPPRTVGRSAAMMGVATAVSRALGFARVLVVAGVLGTTHLGNTFQASNSVSNVLFELLAAGALSAVLVPGFVALLDEGRSRDAERVAGSLLGFALVVLGAVATVGVLAAPALARLLTSGVDDPAVAAEQRDLATFLLRVFVPQVLLYAVGAVATAVLHAQRRFAVTAIAPIGNTVVIVGALVVFHALRSGRPPDLDLSFAERTTLAAAGTAGVAAFVGIPLVALVVRGFRLRPRWPRRDPLLGRTLRMAGWAGLHNAGVGILLAGALFVGMGVPGGVVAYQVAWVFFLVPYAVLAQSIHTVILPELARDAADADRRAFGRDLRWGLDAMSLLVVPAAAAYVALGRPIMETVAFGETTELGVRMIAGALGALAVGLLPYSAFLLLTRASYALGDSRTPATVAVATAAVGAAFMLVVGPRFGPEGRLVAMGLGHTLAYTAAALVLGGRISRLTGARLAPRSLVRALPVATAMAAGAWAAWVAVDPTARVARLALLAAVGVMAALAYAAVVHPPSLRRAPPGPLA